MSVSCHKRISSGHCGMAARIRHRRRDTASRRSRRRDRRYAVPDVQAGLDTVCVARRLGSYPIQVLVLGAGVRRPIGFSASGIALLASMPPAAARHIAVQNRVHLRANGATVESAIVATAKARKLGYAFRERGIVPGTRAVSIAFGNRDGEALATLTVTAIARGCRRRGSSRLSIA
jgi:DNA-binding IclR family transcriptional regulator